MNQTQKKNKLVSAARDLARQLEGVDPSYSRYTKTAFFGNQGVTLYADGRTGDIVGHLLQRASVKPPVAHDVEDPKEAIVIALGLTSVADIPLNVQGLINDLATTGDDTKRSYSRRVPKLVRLLNEFAVALHEAKLGSPYSMNLTAKSVTYVPPGKQI